MPSQRLFIIRIGLMAGVFAFAGVSTYIRITGSADALLGGDVLATLRYVLWALVAASALAALFLKPRIEAAEPARRALLLLIGWSFGEGVALFGTVLFYAGAPTSTMALGLLAFVFALLVLPVPRDRR